jgi:hypothetical protein
MGCFSCSNGKSLNTVQILQMYKEAYNKTGKLYWFFKEEGSNEIKIMAHEDFAKFKSENKSKFYKKKIEFSRIDEFRISENNSVLENS